MNTNVDYKELFKYSIGRILDSVEDTKKNIEDKEYRLSLLQGYYFCLQIIRNDILIWHPCETDEEERQILAEFGLDFKLEEILG